MPANEFLVLTLHCSYTHRSDVDKSHSVSINLAFFCGTCANSVDPDQTPQNVASDQGLHCLLTECSVKILIK